MKKIQTLEQLKSMILYSLIGIVLTVGIACNILVVKYNIKEFNVIGFICYSLGLMVLILMLTFWLLKNNANKGIKYAIKHYLLVQSIRNQFLDAEIYTIVKLGGIQLAKLPWIFIEFDDDFERGRVYVENKIKFDKKLESLKITSALKNYVVEQVYLSNDENYYLYDLYDSSIERRITFKNLGEFKEYVNLQEQYDIFIDSNVSVPISHTLLVGATRSGKSYGLMCYVLQFLIKKIRPHLYFIDLKYDSTSLLGREISPENTAEEYDDIIIVLERFVAEMQNRKIIMRENLKNRIIGDYATYNLSPHILIFDEYASFSSILQSKEKKHRDYVNSLITQVVLMGAGLGFYIFMIAQKSGHEIIPTHIRDNLLFKTVLGNAEDTTYQTAFGQGVDIPNKEFKMGEGVFTYSGITNKPRLCSFSTLDFDIYEAFQTAKLGYCKYPSSENQEVQNNES